MMGEEVRKIGAFEAKTRLSELVRKVEQGESFIICRRGKEVARLVPPVREEPEVDLKKILSSFRAIRNKISGKVDIRKLIEQGRRF